MNGNSEKFHSRIDFDGDIVPVLQDVSNSFQLGQYKNHSLIEVGYEDYNLGLETDKGKFFVKVFGSFRDSEECKRYASLIEKVIEAGVRHPKLYQIPETKQYLFSPTRTDLQLIVMEWIEDKSFFELDEVPTDKELADICEQAAKINKIDYNIPFTYDSWAVVNILNEYKKWQQHLENGDKALIDPVIEQFEAIQVDTLPKALVHGDIIKTNVIKATGGKLYFFDFSVTNRYPRIQELAVLCCSLFFDPNSPKNSKRLYKLAIDEYQKHIKLTDQELATLLVFIKAAHAMHIIGATKSHLQGEGGVENDYWLNLGRTGLKTEIY